MGKQNKYLQLMKQINKERKAFESKLKENICSNEEKK